MNKKKTYLLMVALMATTATFASEVTRATVSSPDGSNIVNIYQETSDGTLYYTLTRNNELLIGKSALGMKTNDGDFTQMNNVQKDDITTKFIDETYPMWTGKSSTIVNKCNEVTIPIKASTGQLMDIIFRVYNDGIAYRYYFKGSSKTDFKVTFDNSQINIPTFSRCWGQRWTYDYSVTYSELDWDGAVNLGKKADGTYESGYEQRFGPGAFAAPLLVESTLGDDCYLLLTDAAVDKWFSRAPLCAQAEKGHFNFVPRGEKNNTLDVTTTRPLKTPWRCAIVGTLTDIAVSDLCANVTDATINDPSGKKWEWVIPGFSSWDWGGQQGGGISNRDNFDLAKQYIDFAAYMGWKYFTLDDGWRSCDEYAGGPEKYVKDIIQYAKSKGVEVWLWNNSGGFSGGIAGYRTMLKQFHDWGAVGAKIDFFYDGDTKGVMEKQELLLQAAAENQIMVNFHGCPTPTGLRRKYPNLVTVEAVDGNEDYFTGGWNNTGTDPGYNGMLTLMRNVVGPIDYTICEFRTGTDGKGNFRTNTTVAHQLATMVTMESGVQFIADAPKNIQGQKWEDAMKNVPAAWDESICLEATIGPKGAKDIQGNNDEDCNLTMARRSKLSWFVGRTVNRESTYTLDCSFLGEGTYKATVWRDLSADTDKDVLYSYTKEDITKDSKLSIKCFQYGGFFVRFDRTDVDDYVDPDWNLSGNSYEAEDADFVGEGLATSKDLQASGGYTVMNAGQGNWLEFSYGTPYEGTYTVDINYVTDGDRPLTVTTARGFMESVTCASTGGFKVRNGLGTVTLTVPFFTGRNTLRIGHDTEECPYIDNIVITLKEQGSGIASVQTPDTKTIYNLKGQRLTHPEKGIHIINGKKILFQ